MGWLGIVLLGGGALAVYAGVKGESLREVIAAVLTDRPVPGSSSTTAPEGKSKGVQA